MNPNCTRNCEGCNSHYACYCLGVTEEEILSAISTGRVRSIRDLRALTGAGDGCTACHQRLCSYIERFSLSTSRVAISVAS